VNDAYDLIVVGSGVAGLYAALRAAPHRRVLLVTKGALEESNTRYAQGGIAVALSAADSPELHRRDTIAAGDGLCTSEAVAILTEEAPDCILDLLHLGVPFDRDGDTLAWTLEAAHSRPRVLHAGGDATGASIEKALARAVRAAGVAVVEHALCTALAVEEGRVRGVDLLVRGAAVRITAPHVLLASGGAGQLFARTTNPAVATGDGLAIAYRAGAQVMDLEFMQFHPTALDVPGAPSFLISEAVRGEGGILRDCTGRAFMADYHPAAELAPRDVVARAIHQQMMRTGGGVELDVTHLDPALVERRFPSILAFCRRFGIDPLRRPIPVSPAAHYLMGGVRTDSWARTSLPGLFACGEVACTGVHGANRLASNSLLEGLVFARRAVQAMLDDPTGEATFAAPAHSTPLTLPAAGAPPAGFRARLREALWHEVGLVRTNHSLRRAAAVLREMSAAADHPVTVEQHETANLALVARLMLAAAEERAESRGAHFRADYAERDAAWLGHLVIDRGQIGFVSLGTPAATLSGSAA
jgi:L-aspartate oxidase